MEKSLNIKAYYQKMPWQTKLSNKNFTWSYNEHKALSPTFFSDNYDISRQESHPTLKLNHFKVLQVNVSFFFVAKIQKRMLRVMAKKKDTWVNYFWKYLILSPIQPPVHHHYFYLYHIRVTVHNSLSFQAMCNVQYKERHTVHNKE